jgi:hypothetical protein
MPWIIQADVSRLRWPAAGTVRVVMADIEESSPGVGLHFKKYKKSKH